MCYAVYILCCAVFILCCLYLLSYCAVNRARCGGWMIYVGKYACYNVMYLNVRAAQKIDLYSLSFYIISL